MTKLRIYSDIHFDEGLNGFKKGDTVKNSPLYKSFYDQLSNPIKNCIDLIAGDISGSLANTKAFFDTFLPKQHVIFIEGNHIVYNTEKKPIDELKSEFYEAFPTVHPLQNYIDNKYMYIPNTNEQVAIIGSTFYTNYEYTTLTVEKYNEIQEAYSTFAAAYGIASTFKPIKRLTKKLIIQENMQVASERLNDFRWGYSKRGIYLTPRDYLKFNSYAQAKVLECYNELVTNNPNIKIILMTHHCLSKQCIPSQFKGCRSNASYVSDLENWVDKNMPNVRLVISGHVHSRFDFTFGKNKIRYICNPCGYIKYNEPFAKDRFEFNPNFIIDTDEL